MAPSMRTPLGDEKAVLSCQQQLQEIMPLSICFALSVAMGNLILGPNDRRDRRLEAACHFDA